jgi:hypothetical protein
MQKEELLVYDNCLELRNYESYFDIQRHPTIILVVEPSQ